MNSYPEKTVEFVEAYRERSVLWDIQSQEYKKNKAKLDALRGLAEILNFDVAMVK